MKFKNDRERGAFLDDYSNERAGWYLWKADKDIGRMMWRRDLPDCALIVEEQQVTLRFPQEHTDWCVMNWYIIEDWEKPFADGLASRTAALKKLKEYGKTGRGI